LVFSLALIPVSEHFAKESLSVLFSLLKIVINIDKGVSRKISRGSWAKDKKAVASRLLSS